MEGTLMVKKWKGKGKNRVQVVFSDQLKIASGVDIDTKLDGPGSPLRIRAFFSYKEGLTVFVGADEKKQNPLVKKDNTWLDFSRSRKTTQRCRGRRENGTFTSWSAKLHVNSF